MIVKMVVGAGYGDEGKGLAVDWLYKELLDQGKMPVVVRYNGGTQAAHTVQYADGSRLVWHNLNSATAQGARTYLARKFILNPIGLSAELRDPEKAAHKPSVFVSPECRVTLPVDMMLNQMMETQRTNRHGSCGWGVGETVERSLDPDLAVTAADLATITWQQVQALTKAYLAKRLPKLGVDSLGEPWAELLHNPAIYKAFVDDCRYVAGNTRFLTEAEIFEFYDAVLFEGAQGLGLCQDAEHFPHVTRSKTGVQWALDVLERSGKKQDVESLEVFYVTRAYATRHGAGPLEKEGRAHGCRVEDATNVENPWQGTLRTAPLDCTLTSKRIYKDVTWALAWYPDTKFSMLMTHVDCVTPEYNFYPDTPALQGSKRNPTMVLGYIAAAVRVQCIKLEGLNTKGMRLLVSLGPTRQHVKTLIEDPKDMMGRVAAATAKLGVEQ